MTLPAKFEYGQELDAQGNIVKNGPWGLLSSPKEWMPYMIKNFSELKDGGIAKIDVVQLDAIKASTKLYTDNSIAIILGSAPAMLDTFYELSNALGGDPNFATTVLTEVSKKANTIHGHTWGQITGTPTTVAGYGLTDVYTKTASDSKYAPNGFGIGSVETRIVDLDNTYLGGAYWYNFGTKGTPPVNLSGHVIVSYFSTVDSRYTVQKFTVYDNSARYERTTNGITWSVWKKIATTDNPVFTGDSIFDGKIGVGRNPLANLEVNTTGATDETGANLAFSAVSSASVNVDRLSIGWIKEDVWSINSADTTGQRNLSLQTWGGNVGVGTTTPKKLVDVYVPHAINQDGEIRVGSLAGVQGYYGIGLNYVIDKNGNPNTGIVNYWGGEKKVNISFPFNDNSVVVDEKLGVGVVPQATLHSIGDTILGALSVATWGCIGNSQLSPYINETYGTLDFLFKLSNGAQKRLGINYTTGAITILAT